jgi:RNA polymerase sigma factor (sigma-70 family)
MNTKIRTAPTLSDEQLWRLSRDGDREAFGRIIERYQTLICSLAFSGCGSLATSEDLAQETFIAAWRRLGDLREPGKLRHWLCGIVRNLAANAVRRDLRRGGAPASLEVVADEPSPGDDPAVQAVKHEEETLLWRALAGLPENYREPLVLFYREDQSVAEVASGLDISEEVVRQRLARGRAMLREELAVLVESTLTRTRPGTAFTASVLVALPMVSGSAAGVLTAGAAGKSAGTAGKGILAKLGLGVLIGPVIGFICAYIGTTAAASTARSKAERNCILRYTRRAIVPFCFIMSIGLAAVLSQAGKLYPASATIIVLGVSAWTALLVGGIIVLCRRMDREVKQIRIETNTTDEAYAKVLAAKGKSLRLPKHFESRTRFLGLPLFAAGWGGTKADRNRSRTVFAWFAFGDIAISPFLAVGGVAVGPIAIGAVTLGVLSLSVFWGVAVGVLAVGSLAFGWWALGCAAAGVKCAVGFAALARDYAVGIAVTAAEAGTATAKEWVTKQWFSDFSRVLLHQAHSWILLCVVVALVLARWRAWQLRRLSRADVS